MQLFGAVASHQPAGLSAADMNLLTHVREWSGGDGGGVMAKPLGGQRAEVFRSMLRKLPSNVNWQKHMRLPSKTTYSLQYGLGIGLGQLVNGVMEYLSMLPGVNIEAMKTWFHQKCSYLLDHASLLSVCLFRESVA